MTIDILLINARQDALGEGGRDKSINIGLALLASFVKKNGYSAGIFRGFIHQIMEWAETVAGKENFRCAGFYCDNENYMHVSQIIKNFKNKWNVPVVAGGPQSAYLGREFLIESGCDVIIHGEAEYTLLEVLSHFTGGGSRLSQITGISFLDESANFVKTPDRQPIEDLDALPFPDYLMEKNSLDWHGFPVMSGRGCPYRCAFCHEGNTGGKIRFRSVKNVIDEIKYHFDRHPRARHIFFSDDTFTADPRRVEALSKELAALRKEKDFMWHCMGHVRPIAKNPEMLESMVESGLGRLFLGVESGSDEVLEKYGKHSSAEMIESVVSKAVAAGVPQISGNIIMGGYMASEEMSKEDLAFSERLMRIGPGKVELSGGFLMPYPGTAVRRDPDAYGLRLCLERESHALTDMPLTATEKMPWDKLIGDGFDFNIGLYSIMKKMYLDGEVADDTILQNYILAVKYGLGSLWLTRIFAANPVDDAYFKMLASDIIIASKDISEDEINSWHPQRVFEICGAVEYAGGGAFISGRKLSALEYELLLLCSGKNTLSKVYTAAREKFLSGSNDESGFAKSFKTAVEKMESLRWIGYTRF
jgi:radical SAM superfamily enzyme YgiQ (UPF0313 family)